MLSTQLYCVGPRTTRSATLAPVVRGSTDGGTSDQLSDAWSAGPSATRRSAIWACSRPNVIRIASGYALRIGSVAGSQFGLRSSSSATSRW